MSDEERRESSNARARSAAFQDSVSIVTQSETVETRPSILLSLERHTRIEMLSCGAGEPAAARLRPHQARSQRRKLSVRVCVKMAGPRSKSAALDAEKSRARPEPLPRILDAACVPEYVWGRTVCSEPYAGSISSVRNPGCVVQRARLRAREIHGGSRARSPRTPHLTRSNLGGASDASRRARTCLREARRAASESALFPRGFSGAWDMYPEQSQTPIDRRTRTRIDGHDRIYWGRRLSRECARRVRWVSDTREVGVEGGGFRRRGSLGAVGRCGGDPGCVRAKRG